MAAHDTLAHVRSVIRADLSEDLPKRWAFVQQPGADGAYTALSRKQVG